MALFLVPALHSALLVPSSGLLRSSSSALSMQSLNARSSYGSIIRADEPEIDPRRKDPPGKGSPGRFVPLPTVGAGDDKMDVMSRLLKDRARLPPCTRPLAAVPPTKLTALVAAGILLLGSQVDDEVGNVLVAQLLYLANEDAQKDVTLYINSPGGSVSAGMAIFDTMNYVPPDVNTVCFGAPPPHPTPPHPTRPPHAPCASAGGHSSCAALVVPPSHTDGGPAAQARRPRWAPSCSVPAPR